MIITRKKLAIEEALEIGRKFGFIPRQIFWDFMCPPGRAARYDWWKELSSHFGVDRHAFMGSYLVLNSLYRKLSKRSCVGPRSPIYFEHDEILIRLALRLKAEHLIFCYWTEQELKMKPLMAMELLGGEPHSKIPDLVVDFVTPTGPIRAAIEVERTRKSNERYTEMQYDYAFLRNIDLVLFAIASKSIDLAIENAFSLQTVFAKKKYGIFSLEDLARDRLNCSLKIGGGSLPLVQYLRNLSCGKDHPNSSKCENDAENSRTDVREKMRKVNGPW